MTKVVLLVLSLWISTSEASINLTIISPDGHGSMVIGGSICGTMMMNGVTLDGDLLKSLISFGDLKAPATKSLVLPEDRISGLRINLDSVMAVELVEGLAPGLEVSVLSSDNPQDALSRIQVDSSEPGILALDRGSKTFRCIYKTNDRTGHIEALLGSFITVRITFVAGDKIKVFRGDRFAEKTPDARIEMSEVFADTTGVLLKDYINQSDSSVSGDQAVQLIAGMSGSQKVSATQTLAVKLEELSPDQFAQILRAVGSSDRVPVTRALKTKVRLTGTELAALIPSLGSSNQVPIVSELKDRISLTGAELVQILGPASSSNRVPIANALADSFESMTGSDLEEILGTASSSDQNALANVLGRRVGSLTGRELAGIAGRISSSSQVGVISTLAKRANAVSGDELAEILSKVSSSNQVPVVGALSAMLSPLTAVQVGAILGRLSSSSKIPVLAAISGRIASSERPAVRAVIESQISGSNRIAALAIIR